MDKKAFEGSTTWAALVALSRKMMNGDRDFEFRPGFVYMAPDSWGGRLLNGVAIHQAARERADHHVEGHFDGWYGFSEESVVSIEWVSGSSGARIEAWRKDGLGGNWLIRFEGADIAQLCRESSYITDFAEAVADPAIAAQANAWDRRCTSEMRPGGSITIPQSCEHLL